jgi:hypothetical protein
VSVREKNQETEINEVINPNRRVILSKLGRFGAYTAPILLASLDANKAVACSEPQCL